MSLETCEPTSFINRFLPSTEEAEMYKNYKEDPSTLVQEDQFMMKVITHQQLASYNVVEQ